MSPAVASAAPPVTSVATTSVAQASPCRCAAISSPERGSATTTRSSSPRSATWVAGGHPSPHAERVVTGVICQRSPTRSATRTSGRAPATVYATTGAPDPSHHDRAVPPASGVSSTACDLEGGAEGRTRRRCRPVQVVWMSAPRDGDIGALGSRRREAREGRFGRRPKGTVTPPGDSLRLRHGAAVPDAVGRQVREQHRPGVIAVLGLQERGADRPGDGDVTFFELRRRTRSRRCSAGLPRRPPRRERARRRRWSPAPSG